MIDTLLHIKEEMSMAILAGSSYPIVEVTKEYAVIAATAKKSATNIGNRTGGEVVDTPLKEFPYEIRISLTMFDRISEANKWSDLIDKLLTVDNS